jgi:hypothetical protein
MVNLIAAIAARVASLLNNKSLAYNKAVASITYRALAKGYSISNISWLAKQIALETNWGTSNSIEVDLNAWGMNCVSSRETNQIGCREVSNFESLGQYASLDASCADRLSWDMYWGYDSYKRSTLYPEMVSQKYHTSTDYVNTVSAVNSRSARVAVWVSVFMIPTEAFLLWRLFKYLNIF